MKTFIFVSAIILFVFLAFQLWAGMSNKTEQYSYTLLKSFDGIEIRQYNEAVFARTRLDSLSYREGSGNGFRRLASYIFGNNDRNENIAMTSPVAVYWQDGMVMEFMMPSQYRLEDLPQPGRSDVSLYQKASVTMAAIRFGGYASDEKIKTYTEMLRKKLAEAGIQHHEVFQYFGYNPPYQMINRRNEIVVEVLNW